MNKKSREERDFRPAMDALAFQSGVFPADQAGAVAGDDAARLRVAQAWQRANQLLSDVFDPALFASPAWSIMLELFIAQAASRADADRPQASDADFSSATRARYLTALAERGWVETAGQAGCRTETEARLTQLGLEFVVHALDGVMISNQRHGIGHLRVVQ
ncbi:hypothetical protein M9978_07935 [Sphingomonas sp. MG17]|uniref:Uncharacterized protein n=1 Tax=Sphingomonas tagetis TaxID=2949092 RepID=A0A9X2HIP8_9SPHN|nr:hypothetical protein [Sphingomonas tagetis]MCP3730357.1 hypothetical protein [Sphingomonas tagetis]